MSDVQKSTEYRSEVQKSTKYQSAELTSHHDLQSFIGFEVVDCDGNKIGTVETIWEDVSGGAAFISVRAGWLGLGKAHVLSSHRIGVDQARRKIKVPYPEDVIKNAPTFSEDSASLGTHYEQVIAYYATYDESLTATHKHAMALNQQHQGEAHSEITQQEAGNETIQLKEERVQVGKREVEYGGYRLRKIVRTERVEQPVELRREELVIERVPVDAASSDSIVEGEIYIPLRREEAVVAKDVRVREEIRTHINTEHETDTVVEEVAHEDIDVERVESRVERVEARDSGAIGSHTSM